MRHGQFPGNDAKVSARTASLSNAGAVAIAAGVTLSVAGNYSQTDGSTTLAGGTLSVGGTVDIQGGLLTAWGTITGNVRNAGQIDVGGPGAAGTLAVTGDFTQTAAGVLNLELGSFDDGTYDQLNIGGTATLDGTLNVGLLDGFFARDGDAFPVLTWGAVGGGFAALNLPDPGDGFFLEPALGDAGLTLTARAQ